VKLNENTISNLLTILIFILVGALLFNYFRSINKVDREQTTSAQTEVTPEMTVPEVVKTGLPAEYTIKPGDSLWKIAESAYGTGYDWVDVYEANKATISDPNFLEIGDKLTLPKIEAQSIGYTVVKGDNLWNISLKICRNGFLWEKIATDNQIPNPQLIEPGLKLTIKCK